MGQRFKVRTKGVRRVKLNAGALNVMLESTSQSKIKSEVQQESLKLKLKLQLKRKLKLKLKLKPKPMLMRLPPLGVMWPWKLAQ